MYRLVEWPPERVALFRDLWSRGRTVKQIAMEMHEPVMAIWAAADIHARRRHDKFRALRPFDSREAHSPNVASFR